MPFVGVCWILRIKQFPHGQVSPYHFLKMIIIIVLLSLNLLSHLFGFNLLEALVTRLSLRMRKTKGFHGKINLKKKDDRKEERKSWWGHCPP